MSTSNKKREQVLTVEQQKLVEQHVEFAMNMGRRFSGRSRGVSVEDLQQEACLGLCEAAMRYQPERDNEFRTYAYSWCLKYIMLALRTSYSNSAASVDVETLAGHDCIDDDSNRQEEYALKVRQLLSSLTDHERTVIRLVYGISDGNTTVREPMDFKKIAAYMQLQPIRVKQLYSSAMDKMKTAAV